ncbi:MAG: RsmE family RNA methyltransferase [Syntrophotaleaceae bacterium]
MGPAKAEQRCQRWQRIVGEAARQSRRPLLPAVATPRPLIEALADCGEELRLMLWEDGSRPLAETLPTVAPASIALLVGPEGGFTTEEARTAAKTGFQPVHLGPRIMRSETAGFAVAAILQYHYGDLGTSGN